ncbi:Phosphatidylinositol 3-kinase 2 [Diplonema papillatum]|nr:Phosphatidylinositol 3-kinase 2 [Diplonema papillatum]
MTEEDNIVKYCYRDMLRTRCGLCCVEGETETKDHLALSIESQVAHMNKELSLWDMDVETEITVQSLSSMAFLPEMVQKQKMLKEGEDVYVCVVGQLIHGMRQLACPQKTPWRVVREAVPSKLENIMHTVWGAPHGTLRFGVKLSHIPRDARLCLTAVVCTDVSSQRFEDASKLVDDNAAGFRRGRTHKSKPEDAEELPLFYLGWVNFMLFDYRDVLRSGSFPLRMWVENQNANPVGVVATPKTDSKQDREKQLTVTISLAKFARPIRFPRGIVPSAMRHQLNDAHAQSMNELDPSLRQNVVNQLRRVRSVIEKDPLYHLEPADKLLLWQFRNDLTTNPCALSKFLQAVDWASPAAVQGALHLLHHPDPSRRWRRPAPGNELIALELLDARYANTRVREYAIDILDNLCDSLLAECILQLVQVLKYEPYHYSALARLLLRRALANPHQIGHAVFWHLKAEMSNPLVQERHGLLIEEMLKRSPISIRRNFEKQDALVEILLKIAVEVKETHVKARERNTFMRQNLDKRFAKIIKPGTTFTLPLDPRMECSGVLVDKCKVMDSKKLPLWLVFKNADPVGDPVFVIFKAGDDLRQDLLTLQILSMMDSFWKAQGMDLHMSCYGCVACDDGVGMIEVVLNAETIASITRDQGGAGSAFSEEPMLNWLRKQQCNKSEEGVKKCLTNFMLSCAGYCVATYILGLGDRHNDNIMMKRDGTYFHIDFGHILGNKKSKFGVKRETTPFIFTPMYAFILGGEKSYVYKHFVSVACRSYNIVRRSAHIIITLFTLMLSTGIPELQTPHDIEYLQKVLMINEPEDSKAAKAYEENIRQAVANRRTLMNDFVHITVHYS